MPENANSEPVVQATTFTSDSLFGNGLETMDRFLSQNEENLLVQLTMLLESKTGVNRYYLARFLLGLGLAYFVLSSSLVTLLMHLLMFLYPSFRTYILLKRGQKLKKEELLYIVKYWVSVSLFTTFDQLFGFLVPFGAFLKLLFIIQFALPARSAGILMFYEKIVVPVYGALERNGKVQQLASWINGLRSNNQTMMGMAD